MAQKSELLSNFVNKPVWNTKEVAQTLGMSVKSLQRFMRNQNATGDKLSYFRSPTGEYRFAREVVLKYLEETTGT